MEMCFFIICNECPKSDQKGPLWSTGFKKQDGGYESNLESHIWDSESRLRDSESRRRDGIRDNPVYGILSPTYGILGFTVYTINFILDVNSRLFKLLS